MTRREWISGALLAHVGSDRPLGIQLYTVREVLPKDPERVFRALAAIGYREMEGRLGQLEGHFPLLQELGMQWMNWMIPTPAITGNYDLWQQFMQQAASKMKVTLPPEPRSPLGELIATAKKHGVRNLGVSYLLPKERESLPSVIDQLNRAGEQCRKAGLTLYYHNHAWEFEGEPGKRPIDLLMARLGKDVMFEVDIFWSTVGGQNPAKLLDSLHGRVLSLHLKDIAKDTPVGYSETAVPHSAFRDAGDGVMDWTAILGAAKAAGVRHYFVEQDYPAGDPLESARKSYQFLKKAA